MVPKIESMEQELRPKASFYHLIWTRSWGYKFSLYSACPDILLFSEIPVRWPDPVLLLCLLHRAHKDGFSHEDYSLSGKLSSCHNKAAAAQSSCFCTLSPVTSQSPQFPLSFLLSDLLASSSSHSESFHKDRLSHERGYRWPRVYLQARNSSPSLGQRSPAHGLLQAEGTLLGTGPRLSGAPSVKPRPASSENLASIPNSRSLVFAFCSSERGKSSSSN